MGVKRDIDTGRFDSLGRPIKVSHNAQDNGFKAGQIHKDKHDLDYIYNKISDFKARSEGSAREQIDMSTEVLIFLDDDAVWENSPDEAMRIAHEHGLKDAVLLGVISQVQKGNFGASLGGGTKRCKSYQGGEDKWDEHLRKRDYFFSDRPLPRYIDNMYIDNNEYGEFLVATFTSNPGEIFPMRKDISGGRNSSRVEKEVIDCVKHLGHNVKVDHELTLDKFCYHNDHAGWEFGDVNYNKRIAPDLILPDDKVIIEVDGGGHHTSNIMDDVERTYRMNQMGWNVIRVRFSQNAYVNGRRQNIDIPYATNIHARNDSQMRGALKKALGEVTGG